MGVALAAREWRVDLTLVTNPFCVIYIFHIYVCVHVGPSIRICTDIDDAC